MQIWVQVGEPQTPFWQVSPVVQALESLHAVPFAAAGVEQLPVAGLQTPATWHWSSAVQVTVEVGEPQVPFWQDSPAVQAFESLQAVPLIWVGFEQAPVEVLQEPAVWH